MNNHEVEYVFTARIWYSEWYFVSLPKEQSKEIRESFMHLEEGWGRLKTIVKIGNSEWRTAIWFDTKHQTYLLPIKSEIRKRERIGENDEVKVSLSIDKV